MWEEGMGGEGRAGIRRRIDGGWVGSRWERECRRRADNV
jgi:hypothetical protein